MWLVTTFDDSKVLEGHGSDQTISSIWPKYTLSKGDQLKENTTNMGKKNRRESHIVLGD